MPGSNIDVKSAVIVDGVSMDDQTFALAKNPHIVIATPGQLVQHLENTKGFSLKDVKYLVVDEADQMLNMDFEEACRILKVMPRGRQTLLFSSTMTKKIEKFQRAFLADPVKVHVPSKYLSIAKLLQYYLFVQDKAKGNCQLSLYIATQTLIYEI